MKTPLTTTLLLLAPTLIWAAPPPPRANIALAHVTVIDGTGAAARPDQTVLIDDGRIAAIGPADLVDVPKGAIVVEGAGKFLMPGLWDMHVHSTHPSTLSLFVANGVTGVRVMWGNPSLAVLAAGKQIHTEWRREIAEGRLAGPRIVLASTMIDGPHPIWPGALVVSDEAEARQAVRDAKKAGADFIKVYSMLPREAYFAIADEAKVQGLPFAGHLPILIGAAEASDAGQRSIEHLTGILTACSTREADLNRERMQIAKRARGPSALAPVMSASMESIRDSLSEDKARLLFAKFRANRTWQCPTLTVLRAYSSLDDETFRADPRVRFVPTSTRILWDSTGLMRLNLAPGEGLARRRLFYRESLKLVGRMQRAGVPILAGTDEINPYCFAGFSLHDELALMVEAGLSPMEAIQTATRNPAEFFGKLDAMGTIERGKIADLVLLDADPLADIHNTATIRAVIADGRLLDRAALDRLLAEAEASTAGTKTQAGHPEAIAPHGGFCPDDLW